MPPPHSVIRCSQSAPSVLAKILSVWKAEKRASVSFTPGSVRRPASAASRMASLSSSETSNGSRSTGFAHSPCAGGSGASGVSSGTAGWASAMASARASAASASRRSVPRTAAKPHTPPTLTRTPMPSLSPESSWSSLPLRVDSRSTLERTKRASA